MAAGGDNVKPRTYFLNESHELSSIDKGGGGRTAKYVGISWGRKAQRISSSLDQVLRKVDSSRDPLRKEKYFVVAKSVPELVKRSEDKRKAPEGTFRDPTLFGGVHGRVFDRLGLDLLQVTDAGQAVVHGSRERVEQLIERSKSLESLGTREQSRWVTIDAFETVPVELRVDGEWLSTLNPNEPADVVFELQPVLGRVDADRVLRAIADLLRKAGERITGVGTDFSGRYWFRGKAVQSSVREVAKDFFSVQAIHSPLFSLAVATKKSATRPSVVRSTTNSESLDARALPCVAVVDLGVPADHMQLAPYRRGQFTPQDASTPSAQDHGSFVASRVVFGEFDSANDLSESVGLCSFYDAMVGAGYANRVNDKIVLTAMQGVRGAAPDVRVFNLSFGDTTPLAQFPAVEQREKRLLMQDLDNFAFTHDALIVVAAGNSAIGVPPNPAYPTHAADPRWALGPWACGFNTIVCGSYVGSVSADGLAANAGWPSPFSRVGPGICGAPVPSFGAPGGNVDATYNMKPGMGVLGFSGAGFPEDRCGTSFAAPLLAREAALALAALQKYCIAGTQPFAVTVRAFLALAAEKTTSDSAVLDLCTRTLGLGQTSSIRLNLPRSGSAVILWQGIIESSKDTVRVQFPIPKSWLSEAVDPRIRMFICSDPPVNEAAKELWACRKVKATLHPGADAHAVHAIRANSSSHETYPQSFREFKLAKYAPGEEKAAKDDLWVVELSYDDIFDYPPGMDFDPRQRVALASELIDRGAEPVDPQAALQKLPTSAAMNRLSIQQASIRNPVIIRTRS